MDAEERRNVNRVMRRLNNQRRTAFEHLQSRSRQLDVMSQLLQQQLKAAGLEPTEVRLYDQIDPKNGGISMLTADEDQAESFHAIEGASSTLRTEQMEWWPSIDAQPGPLKPSPGWQNIKLLDQTVRTVGVMLLGQTPDVIDRVVATFLRQQTQRLDFIPIFIIDSAYTDPFLQNGFVMEMIPPPEDQKLYSGTRPWLDFVMDRLLAIREKWFVVQFLEFGKTRYHINGLAQELETDSDDTAEEESLETLGQSNDNAAEIVSKPRA